MEKKNELIEIQEMTIKQMKRLDSAVAGEVKIEVARSGALSSNASAYLKAVNTSLKIKEMVKNNPKAEETILKEIGVIDE